MTTHKVSELTGAQLDAAVAKAEGLDFRIEPDAVYQCNGMTIVHPGPVCMTGFDHYQPSAVWSHGGPIIEREAIQVAPALRGNPLEGWVGAIDFTYVERGQTPLIAAMRAYTASRFGETVELP